MSMAEEQEHFHNHPPYHRVTTTSVSARTAMGQTLCSPLCNRFRHTIEVLVGPISQLSAWPSQILRRPVNSPGSATDVRGAHPRQTRRRHHYLTSKDEPPDRLAHVSCSSPAMITSALPALRIR